MENILKLLFALAILSIFSYLLIYTMMASVGNGGECWDFDGHTEPHRAAVDLFESQEYLLLSIDMPNPLGGEISTTPRPIECHGDAGSMMTTTKVNRAEVLHGHDSIRLASAFAERFNRTMFILMHNEIGYRCRRYID